jgi:hypothetical protein
MWSPVCRDSRVIISCLAYVGAVLTASAICCCRCTSDSRVGAGDTLTLAYRFEVQLADWGRSGIPRRRCSLW